MTGVFLIPYVFPLHPPIVPLPEIISTHTHVLSAPSIMTGERPDITHDAEGTS